VSLPDALKLRLRTHLQADQIALGVRLCEASVLLDERQHLQQELVVVGRDAEAPARHKRPMDRVEESRRDHSALAEALPHIQKSDSFLSHMWLREMVPK
jgi:hypothetical protein